MERMQLQEDKCQPGRMQLKAEASTHVGGSFPIMGSLPDSWNLCRRPLNPHASLEPGNSEIDLCCFYCEARHILYIT
jgi:hypothetical protein